jgi:hypothetical protein
MKNPNLLKSNSFFAFRTTRILLPFPAIKIFDKRGNICYVTAASEGDKKWFHFLADK